MKSQVAEEKDDVKLKFEDQNSNSDNDPYGNIKPTTDHLSTRKKKKTMRAQSIADIQPPSTSLLK